MALMACTPLKGRCITYVEWSTSATPLRVSVWERRLASHPDRDFFLILDEVREEDFITEDALVGQLQVREVYSREVYSWQKG